MEINAIDRLRMDGMSYEVETIETNELGFSLHGQIDYDKLKITLRNAPPAIWLQTLWHELLHHISEYRLSQQNLTEAQVDGIATGINAILLDNPDLPMEIWQVATGGDFTIESEDEEPADESD